MIRRYRKWEEWRKLTRKSKARQILVLLGLERSDHFDKFVTAANKPKISVSKKRTRGDAIRCLSDENLADLFAMTFVKGAFLAFEEFCHKYDSFEQYTAEDETFKKVYPVLLEYFVNHLKGEDDGEYRIR